MSKKRFNSRELRQLAEGLLEEIASGDETAEVDRGDLLTSLVRQWITYDGNATLFIGERQLFLELAKAAPGKVRIVSEQTLPVWMKRLIQDWKIRPDELPQLIRQLNLGQSVEMTNEEGLPIRLWVNPKEKSKGVESLFKQPVPPGHKRDHRKIAVDQLEHVFGTELDPKAMEELASSVVKQWQQHDGHACLFFRGDQQLSLTLTEQADGGCKVSSARQIVKLELLLASLNVPLEIIPGMIARMNLGQEIEFQDTNGVRSALLFDPKLKRVRVRRFPIATPMTPSDLRPVCCPKCGAVLAPRRGNEPLQACSLCGHVILSC